MKKNTIIISIIVVIAAVSFICLPIKVAVMLTFGAVFVAFLLGLLYAGVVRRARMDSKQAKELSDYELERDLLEGNHYAW